MTKAVSNREMCFIKAVLSLCEHRHFSLNFASHDVFCPPPSTIRVKSCCCLFVVYRLQLYYYIKIEIIMVTKIHQKLMLKIRGKITGVCQEWAARWAWGRRWWSCAPRQSSSESAGSAAKAELLLNNGMLSANKGTIYCVHGVHIRTANL